MPITNNATQYQAVDRYARRRLQQRLEPSDLFYRMLCMIVPSTSDKETYDWAGGSPQVREWLGDVIYEQMSSADFTIANREFQNGVRLPKKDIDDGKLGYFDNVIDGLGEMFDRHPDKLMFDLFKQLESTECFDGQNFFDTDHEWGDSGQQSNIVDYSTLASGGMTVKDVVTLTHLAMIRMLQFKNDKGEAYVFPTASALNDMTLVCGYDLWPIVSEAFNVNIRAEDGAAVQNFKLVNPTVVPVVDFPANTIDFYRTGGTMKPFVFQERTARQSWTKGADDPEQRDIKVGMTARYNLGVLAWWMATRVKVTITP